MTMPKESDQSRARRAERDNRKAAQVPYPASYDGVFGHTRLVGPTHTQRNGWDLYAVEVEGTEYTWSSAFVHRSPFVSEEVDPCCNLYREPYPQDHHVECPVRLRATSRR